MVSDMAQPFPRKKSTPRPRLPWPLSSYGGWLLIAVFSVTGMGDGKALQRALRRGETTLHGRWVNW